MGRAHFITNYSKATMLVSVIVLIVMITLVVYHATPTVALTNKNATNTQGSRIENKSIDKQSSREQTTNQTLIYPPFRVCITDDPGYSNRAIYKIVGTPILVKSSGKQNISKLNYLGPTKQDMTIMIINNVTIPMSAKLVVNNNISLDLKLESMTSDCASTFIPLVGSGPSPSGYPVYLFQSNPPLRTCTVNIGAENNSAIYAIKTTAYETPLLNNLLIGKQNITITITNDLIGGGMKGSLVVNNKTIDLQITEMDTVCSSRAF